MEDIYCIVTGQLPKPDELDLLDEMDDDCPTGWTKVSVLKKTENPEYSQIVAIMDAEIAEGLKVMATLTDGEEPISTTDLEQAKSVISLQVKAKWSSLLQTIQQFNFDEKIVYISDSNISEVTQKISEIETTLELK